MMETNRKEEAGAFTLEGARYRREPEGILLEQAADTEEVLWAAQPVLLGRSDGRGIGGLQWLRPA